MKKIFIVISFLMFTTVYFSNAQAQLSTEAITVSADGSTLKRNSFIIITTKTTIKNYKLNVIDITGLDDASTKNKIESSYDKIIRIKSQEPSNNTLIQLLNTLGAIGFSVVGTTSAATDTELINSYTLSIPN